MLALLRDMLTNQAPATLLCVDDEAPALALRKMVLERNGYTILTAANTQQAIELFKAHAVDLVVSDHLLGGELGTELAAELKRLKPKVPIILLAGAPPESLTNIDAFFLKGEPVERLLALFRALLARPTQG